MSHFEKGGVWRTTTLQKVGPSNNESVVFCCSSWKRELKGLNAEIDRRLMEEGDTAEDLRKRRTILEDGVRALISLRK